MILIMVGLRKISLTSCAKNIILVVTRSDVLIENGSIATVKCVLFPIMVTKVVNLKVNFIFMPVNVKICTNKNKVRKSSTHDNSH